MNIILTHGIQVGDAGASLGGRNDSSNLTELHLIQFPQLLIRLRQYPERNKTIVYYCELQNEYIHANAYSRKLLKCIHTH